MKTGLILLTLLGTVAVAEVQAVEASALDKILDAGRKAAAPPAMILVAPGSEIRRTCASRQVQVSIQIIFLPPLPPAA
ncbi:MAG: hypothetical protein IKC90_00580 [Akkermansia sp.]|nr:hypothetical protein [Akkermansia sp.]